MDRIIAAFQFRINAVKLFNLFKLHQIVRNVLISRAHLFFLAVNQRPNIGHNVSKVIGSGSANIARQIDCALDFVFGKAVFILYLQAPTVGVVQHRRRKCTNVMHRPRVQHHNQQIFARHNDSVINELVVQTIDFIAENLCDTFKISFLRVVRRNNAVKERAQVFLMQAFWQNRFQQDRHRNHFQLMLRPFRNVLLKSSFSQLRRKFRRIGVPFRDNISHLFKTRFFGNILDEH